MPDQQHERPSRQVRPLQRSLLVIVAVAMVLLIMVRVRQKLELPPEVSARPLAVKVQKMAPEAFAVSRTYIGTLVAAQRVVISAELTGRVRSLPYREGQAVRSGDLLVVLDDTEERREIGRQEAGLSKLEADLRFWTAEHERDRTLFQGRSISQETLDESTRQRDGALAAIEQSRQALALAETRRSYGRVSAPFDGVVQAVTTQPGELAVMGKPLLELVGRSALKATAQVPQVDLSELTMGQRVALAVVSMNEPLEAVVDRIYPALDSRSRTATIEVFLPETPGLNPGMVVSLTVFRNEFEDALVLPRQSIRSTEGGEGVFVVVGGQAAWRPVVTGEAHGRRIVVLSGVSSGDEVILTPSPELRDGRSVQVWVDTP
jgi:RND family efflux transporter MFP subunit